MFDQYFDIFPWHSIPSDAVAFDAGTGSGRWAKRIAPRVAKLHCIDASAEALRVARRSLTGFTNVEFHEASLGKIPLADDSMDMGYCLGVLHHLPDPCAGLRECVRILKPGAPMLIYVYYALEDRPWWFRSLWRLTDLFRRFLSRLPAWAKRWATTVIAVIVYLPLARIARVWEKRGRNPDAVPLGFYRDRSLYTMRTDALDRFGTPLEQRFKRDEVIALMTGAGLDDVRVSDRPPYWCAVGYKPAATAS